MTQTPDASPGRPQASPGMPASGPTAPRPTAPRPTAPRPAALGGGVPRRGRARCARPQAWLRLRRAFGFTTWAAFLYIGIRARRPRWLAWAGLYAGAFAGFVALENPAHPSETAKSVA